MNTPETQSGSSLQRMVSQRRIWKTYPMGAAAAERMERRGMKAHLSHTVEQPCNQQNSALCGVLTFSLCMDDSLATDELPDCPKCRRKLANVPDEPQTPREKP